MDDLTRIIEEATSQAAATAAAKASELDSSAVPEVRSSHYSDEQVNYRDPAQLEQRTTVMEFPLAEPLGSTPNFLDDGEGQLPFPGGGGGGEGEPIPYAVSLITIPADEEADPPRPDPTYEVSVGWGYVLERLAGEADPITYHLAPNLDTPLPIAVGEAVFVKINIKPDGSIGSDQEPEEPDPAVEIVVEAEDIASLAPEGDYYGYHYIKLAELIQPSGSPTPPPELEKWMTGSHIEHFVGGEGGTEFEHMWQVTAVADETDPTITNYAVKGGVATIQGERVVVADAMLPGGNPETVTAAAIYLAVYRDTASRALSATSPPEILYSETELTSDYSAEYTVLAQIEYGAITQCRNDEICSMELMIVENGEFSLIPVQSNSRNTYAPPP